MPIWLNAPSGAKKEKDWRRAGVTGCEELIVLPLAMRSLLNQFA